MASWKLSALFGLFIALAVARGAPAGSGDHDDEHGGLLDDHSHHDGESKEMLRSKFKETKEKQGEIKASLSVLKNELKELKNRLKAEKENGNTAKTSELRALIKKKKKDFATMKEEKKTAQKAKIDLKNQLKSAKAGNKENKEGKGGKDKRKNKKNKKQDSDHRASKEDKRNKNKNKEAEKKQPEPQPPKKNRNKFSEHLDDDE